MSALYLDVYSVSEKYNICIFSTCEDKSEGNFFFRTVENIMNY